ncbi:unnamed protein product [Heterobilharzia americana]|nr:unnamed protein product [Heterobilharzia americana]
MTSDYPEITGGPIWIRKMRTLFRRLDSSGHGYLMVDDILEVGTTIFNIYPKMSAYKYDELVKTLVYLWYEVICTHVSRQLATTMNLNESTFIDNMLKGLKDFFMSNNEKSKNLHLWGPLLNYKRAEDYGALDCGPVWESKMRTMYRRLDINETMKLHCHDLLQIGQYLVQRAHLDRRRSDAVMRAMLHIWVKFLAIDKTVIIFTVLLITTIICKPSLRKDLEEIFKLHTYYYRNSILLCAVPQQPSAKYLKNLYTTVLCVGFVFSPPDLSCFITSISTYSINKSV